MRPRSNKGKQRYIRLNLSDPDQKKIEDLLEHRTSLEVAPNLWLSGSELLSHLVGRGMRSIGATATQLTPNPTQNTVMAPEDEDEREDWESAIDEDFK